MNITKFSKQKILKLPQTNPFFLESVQNNHIQPVIRKSDGCLELQPTRNKKKIQNYVGFITIISKSNYNLQVALRPFYLKLRETADFE